MRLRSLLPTKAKLRIYKTFILSQLTYCQVVWHFCKASDKRKIDRLQENALRAIYRDKNSTYKELLARAKLPSLNNRRLQDIAIIMYQVKNNLSLKYIANLLNSNNTGFNLRNSDDLNIPRVNTTTYGKHSIRFIGPVIWSKLPKDINPLRKAMAVLIFKYFRGIRANGFFQSNTAIFLREILLFYFTQGSSFSITSPNLNVISSANCHES